MLTLELEVHAEGKRVREDGEEQKQREGRDKEGKMKEKRHREKERCSRGQGV